jgi:hypothetical protein
MGPMPQEVLISVLCNFTDSRPKRLFSFVYGAGVQPSPLLLRSFIGLLYLHWMIDGDDCGAVNGMKEWKEKLKY